MVIRSDKFDDVYFSAQDGMAETHHVFLQGNGLPQAWEGRDSFIIAETGFGTGLNFLCAWKLFEETAGQGQHMHFISVEKYPLSKGDIAAALEGWRDDLGQYMNRYLDMYPLRVPGVHRIHVTDRVSLTLWFGDIADVLPQWQDFRVDAWFLDGFTPAKNPEMWTETLYAHMARLSHDGTTLATFTSAGHVRRGLEAAGFTIEKAKGFGRKREMVKGRYLQDGKISRGLSRNDKPKTIAIIGGGLAGCTVAYLAQRRGLVPVIYEAGDTLAAAASGGRLGMVNPKLTARRSAHSDYYTAAYAFALRILLHIPDIDFQQSGSLHLCTDDDKDRRYTGYLDHLGWHADHMYRIGGDLFYPDAASVSPYKLCHRLAEDIVVYPNHKVGELSDIKADIIVLANGFSARDFLDEQNDLPVHSVRGQVSWIKARPDIDKNICFGGYITPQTAEGFHILGSTFQPWDQSVEVRDVDHTDNIDRFHQSCRNLLAIEKADIIGGWAALRTSSKDRFPVVGKIDEKLYISTAHGSHGIISSLMSAEIILSMALHEPIPASPDVLTALSPKRFRKR